MKLFMTFIFLLTSVAGYTQNHEMLELWPGKVPGETKAKAKPIISNQNNDNVERYTEVTDPVMEVFLPVPSKSNGSAIIVCPGGGYNILAYDKEGIEIANWLNGLGYTAFVLQYRIPRKKEGALQDVQRGIRLVRTNAKKWNISPDKIGVMGFSAGGSLSARASTLYNQRTYPAQDAADSASCRPDYTVLIYPAYLDEGPGKSLTTELAVDGNTPPAFIFQTADDKYGNSALVMATALRNANVPVELHLLPNGGHGYGLRPGSKAAETWPLLLRDWLSEIETQAK
ncbi:MAG: alpha/beta hydrolase [Bacteroidales bacterium]|nr:alpha/beta hydrolase [Bacteroidales bacterium]